MKRLHVRESSLYHTIEEFWKTYFNSSKRSRWTWDGVGFYMTPSNKFCFLYSEEPFEDLTIQTDVTVTEIHNSEIKFIEADDRRIRITLKTGAYVRIDL